LPPLPAEALRHEIALAEGKLECRAEAGDAERCAKQNEAPESEYRREDDRDFIEAFDLGHPPRQEYLSGDDECRDGDDATKTNPEGSDGAVNADIALVPFVLDRTRRVEKEKIGRDRRAEDADRNEPVLRGIVRIKLRQ